jgi:LPXTG-site transpeptidase (sortase) family protein
MEKPQEHFITPVSKRKTALTFLGAFFFAFLFFFGVALSISTFAPLVPSLVASIFTSRPTLVAQLPLSPDRLVPFSTPSPEIIVTPYPVEAPLALPYNPEEAGYNWIRIPAIGVAVPVVQSPSLKDADVIATLTKGAALYPNGVTPGALGNAFISAHSTGEPWKGAYRFAFTRINELKAGDALYIDWNGARYSYRISKSEIITPTPEFRVISDRPVPTISLMACWPLWSTKHRMLIHGELTNITQLTKPVTA